MERDRGMGGDGGPSNLDMANFRAAFEYFLMNFSQNEDWPYKRRIRDLNALLPGFMAFKEGSRAPSNLAVPIMKIEMEHLKMSHWMPRAEMEHGGREDIEDTDTLLLRSACESLYVSFKNLPLIYLPEAEDVVKDLYVLSEALTNAVDPMLDDGVNTSRVFASMGSGQTAAFFEASPALLRFRKSLPTFQIDIAYRGRPTQIRDLKAEQVEKLVLVPGIVVQAFRPGLKATRLAIQCRHCNSIKNFKLPVWRQGFTMPRTCDGQIGISERGGGGSGAAPGQEGKCPLDPYFIVSDECTWSDIQTLKVQELPDDVPTGDVPRHLILTLSNSLVGKVPPGKRILACGVFSSSNDVRQVLGKGSGERRGKEMSSSYLHVVSLDYIDENTVRAIQDASSNDQQYVLTNESASGSSLTTLRLFGSIFDSDESERFQAIANNPNVIELVSKSIAPGICGHEHIKMSLACLLFGGSRKQMPDGSSLRGDLNILLLGDPSVAKSQLLKFIQRASPVAVYTSGKGSSAAGLTAAIVKDTHGNFALEGGAMVLADGGVVCIDEFDKMRDDDRVAIHEAMEQQTISIAKAGINSVLSTQCSVLAAANPSFGSYDDSKETADQHNFETTILSRFDCIWLVKDTRDVERDKKIARHIFSLYANSVGNNGDGETTEAPIPLPVLKSFVQYARTSCHPRLSEEASKRLGSYYVQVRDARRNDSRRRRDQIPITVRQLESLARMSESLARMSLSPSVTVDHVERAINLFKLSTMAAASENVASLDNLSEDKLAMLKSAEQAILHRLPINGRASKSTIISDLRTRQFPPDIVARAICTLVAKGVLQERGDATVRRVGAAI